MVDCQKLIKEGEKEGESLFKDAEKERYREISREFPLLLKSPPPLLNEINLQINFESKLTELGSWKESKLNQQMESEDSENYGSETDKSERIENSFIKSYERLKSIKPNMSTRPSSGIISDRCVSQSLPSSKIHLNFSSKF